MAKEYTELQLKAKEAGIKGWHIKLAKTLEDELAEVVEEVVEEIVEIVEEVDPMVLIRLLNGRTWDNAMMAIKCLANKSDLWPYKELIEEEYAKSVQEKKDKLIAQAKKNGK